jgi:hypothetical protein
MLVILAFSVRVSLIYTLHRTDIFEFCLKNPDLFGKSVDYWMNYYVDMI